MECGCASSDACTVVLLPGLWSTAEQFVHLMTSLGKSRRTIGLTFRGFGGSARAPAYVNSERAYEVAAAVQSLGLQRVVLVGAEDGVEIALRASRLMPTRVEGLVLWNADTSGGHIAGCSSLLASIASKSSISDLHDLHKLCVDDVRLWAAASAVSAARTDTLQLWGDLQRSDIAAMRAALRSSLASLSKRTLPAHLNVPILLLSDSGHSDASHAVRPLSRN